MRVPLATALAVAAALVLSAPAAASITIATNAQAPALRVDAKGNAEVSWTEGGVRKTMWVPRTGRYLPGGRITGPDVSKPAAGVALPGLKVLRRTPDGRLWALQAWRVQANGPVELRLARWKGEPTSVEAAVENGRLTGRATFAGKGVYGTSATTAGTQIRHYALVDCRGCGTSGWKRLLGVRLEGPRGTFALALGPGRRGTAYRVSVAGPNRGWTFAPDAVVTVTP